MKIRDMHYDFKMKLNKLDSQQHRNLLIPQIDWILNEAQIMYVELIAFPRVNNHLGFEIGQRSIDDIYTIVEEDKILPVVNNRVTLSDDYWHYISSKCIMKKGNCVVDSFKTSIRQHDDDFENSPFDESSFEWRTVNGVFNKNGIKLFTTDFIVTSMSMTYIRKLKYIHNAQDFRVGGYKKPSGELLTGSVDCELPEATHREIVDLAVLLASGQLQTPDYNIKRDKLTINQIN